MIPLPEADARLAEIRACLASGGTIHPDVLADEYREIFAAYRRHWLQQIGLINERY